MAQILVSTWNQLHSAHNSTPCLIRIDQLDVALKATQAQIDARQLESDGVIKAIFTAPEYFFARENAGRTQFPPRPRYISDGDHNSS